MEAKYITLYDAEDSVFEKYPEYKDDRFVCDGLCSSDIRENPKTISETLAIESIYFRAKRRIVFFTKEPNKNNGEDYRDWHWTDRIFPYNFGDSLSIWLRGLLATTKDYVPNLVSSKKDRDVFKNMPLAIVNAKKTSNESESNMAEVFSFAQNHIDLLREQFEYLHPNIIVCCGSSDISDKWKMLNLAKNIFSKYTFEHVNNFCNYCENKKLLLIDSFHPTARINYIEKFDNMFHDFQDFLIRYNNPF